MYPDIEQRDFYPQLNGLPKIIKKDYLKIQGPQRSYKNCVEHFFRWGGRESFHFFFYSSFFSICNGKTYIESSVFWVFLSFFLNLKALQANLTIFRENRALAGVNHPSFTSL